MNLFTNCLGCSWSCLRLSKIHAGRSGQAGMWRSATDGCLGGLAPSGEEAGECMHKAALTFEFLIWHVYIVVLDQRCCSSSTASSVDGSFTAAGVLGALARACVKKYMPRSCSERRVRWKREGRSRAAVANWGSSCMRLPRELRENPGEVLPGEGGKGPWSGEGEERDSLLTCAGHVLNGQPWGMCSSDLSCVHNFTAWCYGNQCDAKDSTSSINSWQKIRWTRKGKSPLETIW